MANYNKIILAGNLTRDPELSYLPSQTPVVEFGLAVNRKFKGKDGQQREDTLFIDCRAYGKQAEVIDKYMSKGRPVLVEGRLQYVTWEGKDVTKRSKHRGMVEQFQFMGGGQGGGDSSGSSRPPQRRAASNEPPPSDFDQGGGDDIPF